MVYGKCFAVLGGPANSGTCSWHTTRVHFAPHPSVGLCNHSAPRSSRTSVVAAARPNNRSENRKNAPTSKEGWMQLIRESLEPPAEPPVDEPRQNKKQKRTPSSAGAAPQRTHQPPSSKPAAAQVQPATSKPPKQPQAVKPKPSSSQNAGKREWITLSASSQEAVPAVAAAAAGTAAAAAAAVALQQTSERAASRTAPAGGTAELEEGEDEEYEGEDEDVVEDWEEIPENRRLPDGRWDFELPESDPMYQPVLTDEMLAEDPPDHRSGYVAVVGYPNAGKSTLINAIVGQKLSIVSYKPQTTRHRIMGIASGKEYQMILYDTPGIVEKQRTKLEERMMAAVANSIKDAEAILAVVDAARNAKEALQLIQPGPDWDGPPMAVVLNKADLVTPEQLAELAEWYRTNCRAETVFPISALTGQGVEDAKAWAVSKMPLGPTLYPKDMASQQPERFFVAEIIREKIFLTYDQEIPYSCQVEIADFKERPGAKDFVSAEILVEKESQVPILLGKGGAVLKKLGLEARKDMEAFLGRPVYLELSVKLAKDWRDKEAALKSFGYYDQFAY